MLQSDEDSEDTDGGLVDVLGEQLNEGSDIPSPSGDDIPSPSSDDVPSPYGNDVTPPV